MAKENLQEDIFGGSKKFNKTFFKKKGGEIMVSAILHAVMGLMGLFAFLVFLALSVVALVPILGSVYYLIADLYKWIKQSL